jgi:AcrR family transcriptional regulator
VAITPRPNIRIFTPHPAGYDDLEVISVSTIYRHFPTRQALAEAVYRKEVAALCDRARHLQNTVPAEEALATFLHEWSTTSIPTRAWPARSPPS